MKTPTNDHTETVRRAVLPEVMFASDVRAALQIGLLETHHAMLADRLGPHFTAGGQVAVLRRDFLDALATLGAGDGDTKEVVL